MNNQLKKILPLLKALTLLLLLPSCGAYLNQPTTVEKARFGETTSMTSALQNLPKTTKPVIVAVYKFRDQTGQYKPSENGSSWSTAVTQGATTILMKALEDSNWFIAVERENVSNLLNERKILRSSKSQLDGKNDQGLPPLYYAGIILEGGVISYDANILTGGVGARYFGAGAASQYRQDRVSIYLRAVSTNTGEVLKTVYTSKTILSQSVDVGLFRFVSFKRLLEVETGFTHNEPSQLAITEAIEKAVYNLVIEGLLENYWVADSIDITKDKRIVEYKAEKIKLEATDFLGREKTAYRTPVWFSVQGLATRLNGDLRDPLIRPGIEMGVGSFIGKRLGWELGLGYNHLSAAKYYDSQYISTKLDILYRVLPNDRFSPTLNLGIGFLKEYESKEIYINPILGLNFEYILVKRLGFNVGIQYHYILNDKIDNVENGNYNDYMLKGNVGLKLYLGNSN